MNFRGNALAEADLANLRSQRGLTALALEGTDLNDAGMESLRDLTGLTVLNLTRTQISDAGLVHLHRMKELRFLVLSQTRITDAGLEHVASLPQLEFLGLSGTSVTPAGVQRLKKLLTGCNIEVGFDSSPPPQQAAVSTAAPAGPKADATATLLDAAVGGQPVGDGPVPVDFGRYYMIKTLGEGRMGTVFLAHDEQLDRKVALKIPKLSTQDRSDARERFLQEARLAAKLHHRNICPVYDIGEFGGHPYLAMAYIEGRELTQFINSKKRQPETVVATVIRKLALALREAHANGILHRDLKPDNVMIDLQHEPVVMDFGLARMIVQDDARMTAAGTILGTPAYMSPEQVEGEVDQLGPPSDVFSLGILFYELLTGDLPFQGSVGSVMTQIVMKNPPPPSELRAGLDPELEAICLRMLSKRIEDRYKSMSGVAVAITEYLKTAGRK